MAVHSSFLVPTRKMLQHVDAWLGKAQTHAQARGFDPDTFLTSRLAPDQYPLARQVQAACDAAKLGAARLTGKEAPVHPDTEQTLAQLRGRVAAVVDWLGALTPADFAGWEQREVVLPFLGGKVMHAQDYLLEMALPNFYFHANMAYAILRHNGVELGKRDYLGSLTVRDTPASA